MAEPLVNYLGKPASSLLEDQPFKLWAFKRSVDEDLPDRRVNYVFPEHDLELICDDDERISTIFIHADGVDHGLIDIPFSSGRVQVLGLLGTPSKRGNAYIDPILGEYGAWDRFTRSGYAIHVQYRPHADKIKLITLMRADVLP